MIAPQATTLWHCASQKSVHDTEQSFTSWHSKRQWSSQTPPQLVSLQPEPEHDR